MNVKHCGSCNIRKHKEIKGSYNYVTLDILSKFDSLDKMKTTSSESKGKLETSGKGLVNSMGFKTKVRSKRYKKARYAIGNVSEKDLSKIMSRLGNIIKV